MLRKEPSAQPVTKMEIEFERAHISRNLEYHAQMLLEFLGGVEACFCSIRKLNKWDNIKNKHIKFIWFNGWSKFTESKDQLSLFNNNYNEFFFFSYLPLDFCLPIMH